MSVESKKIVKVFALPDEKATPVKIAWTHDNRSMNYITANGPHNLLWHQSLQDVSARLIADLGDERIEDFALSPDGRNFGFIRGKWMHEAVLIEGLK